MDRTLRIAVIFTGIVVALILIGGVIWISNIGEMEQPVLAMAQTSPQPAAPQFTPEQLALIDAELKLRRDDPEELAERQKEIGREFRISCDIRRPCWFFQDEAALKQYRRNPSSIEELKRKMRAFGSIDSPIVRVERVSSLGRYVRIINGKGAGLGGWIDE